MSTPQHVAELVDIEAMRLKIGKYCGFFRPKALRCLDQPAPVTAVSSGQLHE
jgi:hypothetical protein